MVGHGPVALFCHGGGTSGGGIHRLVHPFPRELAQMKTRPATTEELKAWTKAEIRRLLCEQANRAKAWRARDDRDKHRLAFMLERRMFETKVAAMRRMLDYALNGELE